MKITEVRIKPMNVKNEKLKAFASITIDDDFVVRDLKVIEGGKGLFVAMPSRKLSDYCPDCRSKNHLRAKFCSDCGVDLSRTNFGKGKIEDELSEDGERGNMHADIAHPVNSECRETIQTMVVKAYNLCVQDKSSRGIFTETDLVGAPVHAEVKEEAPVQEPVETFEAEPAPEPQPAVEEKPVHSSNRLAEPAKDLADTSGLAPESDEKQEKRRFGLGIFS